MPIFPPARAALPGHRESGGRLRGVRRTALRNWLLVALALMLVFVKSVDLHLHEHLGAPLSAMHFADASTAHDAGHGDLDVEIQGQGSLQQIPALDLLPMLLLLTLPLLFALVANAPRPRPTSLADAPPPWRHRANTPPPAAGPPLH